MSKSGTPPIDGLARLHRRYGGQYIRLSDKKPQTGRLVRGVRVFLMLRGYEHIGIAVADPRCEPVPGIGHDAGKISHVLLSGQLSRPGAQFSLRDLSIDMNSHLL